jgi:hypothetical protein
MPTVVGTITPAKILARGSGDRAARLEVDDDGFLTLRFIQGPVQLLLSPDQWRRLAVMARDVADIQGLDREWTGAA